MPGPVLAIALALLVAAHAATAADPREIVRRALRAVEGDSARAVAVRWQEALRRDSTDRAAALGLATLARLTYDYPTAERLYRRLFTSDSATPDHYAAYARLGQAWAHEERGRSEDAGDEFARARRVARAAGDSAAEGEALLGLAFARGGSESMAVVMAVLDTAGRLIPASAPDLHAERRWRRAVVLGILADSGATAEATASVELARRAGNLRGEAQALRALAKVLDWRGQEDSALAAFRQAEHLFRRARDRSWLAVTLMNRANSLRKRGDLGDTKEALRLTLTEGEASHNLWAVASAHTGLGAMDMQLGDFVAADEHLNKAVAMFEAQGDRSSAMNARKFLSLVALAAGDFAAARKQTLEALAFYRGTGETLDQFGEYQTLATIAMRERDWAAAERALEGARALLGRLDGPQWGAELAYEEGRLALARGDLATGERSFARYLRTLDSTQHVARYDARLALADIYAQRGESARAEREATSGWDELDRWRATLSDRELRLLVFQAVHTELQASPVELNAQGASVARVLGALAAGGRAEVAFALAERRRARELGDRLVRAAALRSGSAAAPRAAGTAPNTERVTVRDVAAAIPDGHTALLEFVGGVSGAPTAVFVVQRAGLRVRVLPPTDSLAERIGLFATLLESGADPRALARALAAAVLDSALAALDSAVTRLVVVPDGTLHRLPFDALRLADGRYAVERYAIGLAPSAAVAVTLWRLAADHRASGPRPARLLAFGDPTFPGEREAPDDTDAESAAETYRSAFESAGGLPRLPASADEARLVARYAPNAEVRLRERASATFLKRAPLDSFRVIHFATHALVDEASIARTGLALAPGGGESGFVGAGDLGALRLDADLVVLSACGTAGGVVVGGEGVQGLTAPLLAAGARSVVATRWRIGDRSTVAFAQDFYAALARGLPVSDALRAAKLAALRRGAPPRKWAAFTLVGDPFVRVPLRAPRPLSRWWPVAATLGAGGALAYGAAMRRRRARARRTAPVPS